MWETDRMRSLKSRECCKVMAEIIGGRVWDRLRLGWMDGVKVAFGSKGMAVEAAWHCMKDRKEWRALVHK